VGAKRCSTCLIRDLEIDSESGEDAEVRAADEAVVDAAIGADVPRAIAAVVVWRTEPPIRTAFRCVNIYSQGFGVVGRLPDSRSRR